MKTKTLLQRSTALTTLLLGLLLLGGCSAKLTNELTLTNPDLPAQYIREEDPNNPVGPKDFAIAYAMCYADLELLYGDVKSYRQTKKELTKKWYQFWR